MKEWKKYKLGELITLKYGKDHKKLNDGSFPVYGSGGVMRYGNDYIYDDSSILIPRKGSLNNIMFVDKPFWTVDTMFWSIIDQELVLPRFLYYTLCKYDFAGLNVGSAVPSLTVPVIESIEVVIPSIEKQKRILSLLVPLDDKIALNQRINDNLEQQAQALFKSWFVDFEPFKDGEFVNSEFGMIPKGWRTGVLSDIIEILSGFAFKSNTFEFEGKYKLVTIKAVQDGYLELNEADGINDVPVKVPRHCFLKKKDILLSLTGNVGRCCLVNSDNLLLNQRVAKIEPKKIADWAYTYILFRLSDTKTYLETISRGTAQANLSPIETANMPILIPTREVMDAFSVCATPLVNYSMVLTIEAEKLAQQRDTLLPKLMSGELKINDLTR
jgi:type I restriction enzyme S subunit